VGFKHELERRMERLSGAALGETLQQMRMALVESLLDAQRRGATNGKIESGFQMSGVAPLDPMKPLDWQFAIEAPMPGIYEAVKTGAEMNELALTCPEGLEKMSHIEFRQSFTPQMEEMNYRRVWEQLFRKTVAEGRPLPATPPTPFYTCHEGDQTLISEGYIPNLPA
jgi:hypothetical protein